MLLSNAFSNSASCAFLIDETASVEIGLMGNAIYSLNAIFDTNDDGVTRISGKYDGKKCDFSISPLSICPSVLRVHGFATEHITKRGGHGPVLSGKLVIELHIWAGSDVSEIALGTDSAVDVRFCFGSADQLSNEDPRQLVKPWTGNITGTIFKWPDSQ